MPSRNPLDPIPHPPRTPWLGNLLSLGATSPVQSMAKLAREYWPIYWLDMRGKPIVVVSGHTLVDELCDESRFDKSVRGALRGSPRLRGRRPLHRVHPGAELVEAHNILLPNFSQRAMQGYHPMMLDIAEQLVLKWERLNADDEVDVTARHDLADARHDRALRLRLPLQLVLPRDEPPLRRRHGGRARRRHGADRGQLPLEAAASEGPRRQAARRHPPHERDGRRDHPASAGRAARRGEKPICSSCMLSGRRPEDGRAARRPQYPLPGHHLPDRGARDDERPPVLRASTASSTIRDVLARAYEEVDRVLGPDRARCRPTRRSTSSPTSTRSSKESLRLWPTAPVFALSPAQGHDDRRRVPDEEAVPDRGAHPDAASRPAGWGEHAEVFDPDHFCREAERERPAERLQALRQRPARLHRPAVRPAGGGARARHDPPALQADRPHALPAQDQGDAHRQAGRLPRSRCGAGPTADARPSPGPPR